MFRTLNSFAGFQTAPINRTRGPRLTPPQQKVGKITLCSKCDGMIRANSAFNRLNQLPVERLGRGVIAFVGEQIGQIIETGERIGVLRACNAAQFRPGSTSERFCRRKLASGLKDQRQVV
jgi:hypothetical protein